MNFIPKDIKDSLEAFKKSFKKLYFTTVNALDLNYSKILSNKKICNCNNIDCLCPSIAYLDILLPSSTFESNRDFILFIKEIHLKFNIDYGIFDIIITNNDKTLKQSILKGIIQNNSYYLRNYSYPFKINLPNKLFITIMLIDDKENELLMESSNILKTGVINFGLIII